MGRRDPARLQPVPLTAGRKPLRRPDGYPKPEPRHPEVLATTWRASKDALHRQLLGRARLDPVVGASRHDEASAGDKIVEAILGGRDPGPEASIRKTLADILGQELTGLVKDLAGPQGMIGLQNEQAEHLDVWHWGYLFSRALTIGGGTTQIQKNILGERLLGLPREPS